MKPEYASIADKCPKCGLMMSLAIQEHCELRRCPCGYQCVDMSGETKVNYHNAIGTFTITRSR